MADDIVTRLRECWCAPSFASRRLVDPACDHDGLRSEAADEIERLRLACHYLAGWVSYDNPDVDPHTAVKVAYTKVARSE